MPPDINNNHSDRLKRTEIVRVLKLMPKWEPAKAFSKSANCWCMIPIQTPYTEFRCNKVMKDNSQ